MTRLDSVEEVSSGNKKKKDEERSKPISAIFSDYDGTLCSASAARDKSIGQNRIPSKIKQALQQISRYIPICIISSKDFFFLKEASSFARVISCLMGIEMLTFASNHDPAADEPTQIHRKLLANESRFYTNSYWLEEIARNIESDIEFEEIRVERKYTSDRRILAGITLDWSHTKNREYYKKGVQDFVCALVRHLSQRPQPINLYLQKYNSHPFVDLYSVECNKGIGFDAVLSEISTISCKSSGDNRITNNIIKPGNVLYLGDSENDNPAFRKAGLSIGVQSDSRLTPRLECQYVINFDTVADFLLRLRENQLIFKQGLLTG
jgi:hydroxymethylpyrimidine pyrophosphatase-like HAD family hydrolase